MSYGSLLPSMDYRRRRNLLQKLKEQSLPDGAPQLARVTTFIVSQNRIVTQGLRGDGAN